MLDKDIGAKSTKVTNRMTMRFTQDEWINIIEGADKNLPVSRTLYKAPDLGTEAFAKCIDHTLLKLNATKDQIDSLCEEAKEYNFKVGLELASRSLPWTDAVMNVSERFLRPS